MVAAVVTVDILSVVPAELPAVVPVVSTVVPVVFTVAMVDVAPVVRADVSAVVTEVSAAVLAEAVPVFVLSVAVVGSPGVLAVDTAGPVVTGVEESVLDTSWELDTLGTLVVVPTLPGVLDSIETRVSDVEITGTLEVALEVLCALIVGYSVLASEDCPALDMGATGVSEVLGVLDASDAVGCALDALLLDAKLSVVAAEVPECELDASLLGLVVLDVDPKRVLDTSLLVVELRATSEVLERELETSAVLEVALEWVLGDAGADGVLDVSVAVVLGRALEAAVPVAPGVVCGVDSTPVMDGALE